MRSTSQNLILPSGTAKFGATEYTVRMNGSPDALLGLNDLPVRTVNGTTTYMRDVANVRDGFSPQTNIVRQDGARGVLLSVLKNGGASTLDIVANLRALLPRVAQTLPEDIKITPLFDQSLFVKAAVKGVVSEALIAAALTAAMVLLFLGNWRSTLIIALTIPLSILSSILALQLMGETLNLMTLGGLALSVGILVDQAIVTIENIERHLHLGTPLEEAILVGAGEIGVPAFVSTLCICIVFVPMFFLSGVARFLFVPMAEAVVFAMIASYILSRTLVPTLVMLLMRDVHAERSPQHQPVAAALSPLRPAIRARARAATRWRSPRCSRKRSRSRRCSWASACCPACCIRYWAATSSRAWMRGRSACTCARRPARGSRKRRGWPTTSRPSIRRIVPPDQLETILDNLGVPNSGINLSYSNAGTIGTLDGEILLSLKPDHRPTEEFVTALRAELPKQFPGIEFFFQPADIVTQILNFGLPAAIDVQFTGANLEQNAALAAELLKSIRKIPGAVDAHVHQRMDGPILDMQMDRTRLQQVGLTAFNVGQNVLVSLSGSSQTAPAFWLNPQNGVVYNIAVQTPQYQRRFARYAAQHAGGGNRCGGHRQYATATAGQPGRGQARPATRHRVALQHFAGRRYLRQRAGHRSRQCRRPGAGSWWTRSGRSFRAAARSTMRGQVQTMQASFVGLGVGLVMAIVLVYLLIVVNFQSWIDAAIIVAALPAALAGIAWMLFITGTTLSVPALTGAIMTMGVATANSILVVAFARQRQEAGIAASAAALEAGATRIRPVLMTALAMIIGMIPMALGLGEGAEQNAPLGRAVIGGLLFATVSTLFFVPVVFAGVHRRLARRTAARAACTHGPLLAAHQES